MSDIFLSYDRQDRKKAKTLARALRSEGWLVFMDNKIRTGQSFSEAIERELEEAGCVVVLWSKASIRSHWVRDEAEEGRSNGNLIPVLMQNVRPPMGFRSIQTVNLARWNGKRDWSNFVRLVSDIESKIGTPCPKCGAPTRDGRHCTRRVKAARERCWQHRA